MEVHNKLKSGFLEKVYENVIWFYFVGRDKHNSASFNIKVYFEDEEVGAYFADILVENKIILGLKVAERYRMYIKPG